MVVAEVGINGCEGRCQTESPSSKHQEHINLSFFEKNVNSISP